MADFGFVGASYEAPSIYQDAQECINWRPEIDPTKPQGSRGVVALYPTPGLKLKTILQTGSEVRGLRTLSGGNSLIAVCGEFVYLVNSSFEPRIVGQLSTSSGYVSISDNGENVYIVDGNNRYAWFINEDPAQATFIGSISGTTLTVTKKISGAAIGAGQALFGEGVLQATVITSQLTGTTGGVGTYAVNLSQTVALTNMSITDVEATITASMSGTTLTVTVTDGVLSPGQTIQGASVTAKTIITALGNGTVLSQTIANGGSGYAINDTLAVDGGVYGSSPATYTVSTITTGVRTLGTITGGSSYTNGTYTNVQLTYSSGATATTYPRANIVVSGGAVTSVTLADAGTGFTNTGTVLTAPAASIGGTGSGFSIPVTELSEGIVTGITRTFDGIYSVEPSNPASTITSGKGVGLTLNLTFGSGTGGTGTYVINNSQTVASRTMYALSFTIMPTNDGAFVGGTIVDIVDNYFVYNYPNTQQWASTDLLSPITYGLSFASKFTSSDKLVSLIVQQGQVYLLGENTSEVWANTGTFPFPFQRIPGSSSQHGIVAPFSVARFANSFCYLARNNRGQAQVVIMNGYAPQRISTHAVENTLVNENVSDAIAYTYQIEGHECYVISFPSLDLTWVYDATTALWHKWLWTDENNIYHRHRSNCAALFQDLVIVGDWENGKLYELDPETYTDDGYKIRRLRRCPHLTSDLQRQYFEELQIQFQPGVGIGGLSSIDQNIYIGNPYIIGANSTLTIPGNATFVLGVANQVGANTVLTNPQAMLRWSSDGGSTWSNEHWVGLGQQGKYNNRAIWRRLGWSRDRIFEVSVTDPVKAVIVSANLKATVGEN
jgi:hypothetical protein